jgi:hypothetical protein
MDRDEQILLLLAAAFSAVGAAKNSENAGSISTKLTIFHHFSN